MNQLLRRLRRKLSKPLLFGLYGAIGCLIAALLLGELLLYLTKLPPTIEQSPQAVVLLIDCSGSMDGGKLQEVKSAATSFVQRQDLKQSQFAVIGFGSNVRLGTSLTSDLPGIESAIANLQDGGGTNMASGLQAATTQLQSTNLTRNILLFTDGQPNSETDTLTTAQFSKNQDINLIAVATGDADTNFLTQLTGDSSLVFYASSGQFEQAFRAAETAIYGKQLVESGDTGNYSLVYSILRIGSWTGLLALGTSLALIVGQNHYLHRRLLTSREGSIGVMGGFAAGLTAGAIGQLIFMPVANIPILEVLGRLVGWTILGTLVGGGISFFMPNLKLNRALQAGAIGGSLGAIGFLFAANILGDVAGRFVGAAILGFFIGLAIALIEQLIRKASLIVHWNPREQTTLSLGEKAIVLGSSNNSHIYLPKSQGFYPITAKIYLENGKIVMQYDQEYGMAKGMKKLRHELKNCDRRKLGNINIEVKSSI
ncbi:MAG: VWA domain-containing protein [Xenococcaceae cyanobacterium MO_167.B27]|nr:VWA domain-containing protein [Xenococcaceae cyanobacterium MO_167.B27]